MWNIEKIKRIQLIATQSQCLQQTGYTRALPSASAKLNNMPVVHSIANSTTTIQYHRYREVKDYNALYGICYIQVGKIQLYDIFSEQYACEYQQQSKRVNLTTTQIKLAFALFSKGHRLYFAMTRLVLCFVHRTHFHFPLSSTRNGRLAQFVGKILSVPSLPPSKLRSKASLSMTHEGHDDTKCSPKPNTLSQQ